MKTSLNNENHDRLPALYKPGTAAELLTPETISKLMLGFTAGLENMAIAMQEISGERYDLWGDPARYWCKFCKHLRQNLDKQQFCVDWDKKVAEILLGKRAEEYPGQAEEFRDVFPCHAGMLDMAEVIQVAGEPLVVLHGGQLVPKDDPSWTQEANKRLSRPELGLSQTDIKELIRLAQADKDSQVTKAELKERIKRFREFVRELKELFNKLYNERRLASEEALLHAVASRLYLQETPSWETLWLTLKELFVELCAAAGLYQMEWFMGTEQARFHMTPRTGVIAEWKEKILSIGSFWEELSRYPGLTTDKRWDAYLRKTLSMPDNTSCAIYPLVCSFGTPERNIPAMLVVVSRTRDSETLSRFLFRLANEVKRGFVATIGEIEKKRVIESIAAKGAYVGHDMKTPLHVLANVAPAIELHLKRSGIEDTELTSLIKTLTKAVKSAQDKATDLEQMPVREFVVEPRLKRCDLNLMLDEIIELVSRLGVMRGISVRWVAHPDHPVYCDLDRRYMNVALHAVFDNAVKYSFANTEVRVWLKVDSNQTAELQISNLGIGIPPESKITFFEFGERGNVKDKHTNRSGVGLGLPFAKRIIEAHKGSIEIHSHSTHTPPPENDDYLSHVVDVFIHLPPARSI